MKKLLLMAGVLLATGIVAGNTHVYAESSELETKKMAQAAVAANQSVPKTVEVKIGDYLAKIAEENQTTYPRLYDANANIQDPNVIYPGDKLRVPTPDEQLASRTPVAPTPVAPAKVAPGRRAVQKPRAAAAQPQPAPQVAVSDGSVWDNLAKCESGGNWSINTGNGYYGGLQFSLASWRGVGGSGLPSEASREEQIQRGIMLQARQGWGAWPACTRKLGIR